MRRFVLPVLLFLFMVSGCRLQPASAQLDPYDSGGPLLPEQAAYDVSYYDLRVAVSPEDSTIDGVLRVVARVHSPIDRFVLDLDPRLEIRGVSGAEPLAAELPVIREAGRLIIDLPYTRQPGQTLDVTVRYGGRPRIAPNPPWDGGLTWARTEAGLPWIATSNQTIGADVWWPVKDHVSDEPDSMAIRITVPEGLVAASNGRLRGVLEDEGRVTYDWFVSTPINVYNVALNIAPYVVADTTYRSVTGETIPVQFYVLPERAEDGRALLPEIVDHLAFFEEYLGPYPFRADKYGVAHTPHLGMEHQTIIAYGSGFRTSPSAWGEKWGFDALHHHELSHEWWGNLVTNADWSDMWIHEGFGTYMQPLYLESRFGPDAYIGYLRDQRAGISNDQAVAPRGVLTSQEVYTGDIYSKGAWVLHSLRFLLGDETFFPLLRRMAYPDSTMEHVTDGRQTRFATTDDFLTLAESMAGRELDWFFEVYLRQPDLPELVAEQDGDRLYLRWDAPDDLPFPMPVEVQIGERTERIEIPTGGTELRVPENTRVEVDPGDRVLRTGNRTG